MRKIIITSALSLIGFTGFSQDYQFTPVKDLNCSSVKSQGRTGTCWSYSTSSFLESEIKRIKKKDVDLSEMFNVRNTYPKKAWNYVMRQGKAQFSQGGLAHDVMNSVADYGLVPESAFSGLEANETTHNHSEMIAVLKGMLDVYIKNPAGKLSPRWKTAINQVLDTYLGKNIGEFTFENQKYTPKQFAKSMGIDAQNYVTITSFTHQPLYKPFVLNIPDNFSNGSMYNVTLDEFENTIINAVKNGYTVELDVDVSEKGFSSKNGVAIVPAEGVSLKEALKSVSKEKEIDAAYRQQQFENFNTTDDHLMHIVGTAKDQNGTLYFKTKNSWGSKGNRIKYGGYVYMSSAYIRLKAISVLVHQDALDKKISKKLKL